MNNKELLFEKIEKIIKEHISIDIIDSIQGDSNNKHYSLIIKGLRIFVSKDHISISVENIYNYYVNFSGDFSDIIKLIEPYTEEWVEKRCEGLLKFVEEIYA